MAGVDLWQPTGTIGAMAMAGCAQEQVGRAFPLALTAGVASPLLLRAGHVARQCQDARHCGAAAPVGHQPAVSVAQCTEALTHHACTCCCCRPQAVVHLPVPHMSSLPHYPASPCLPSCPPSCPAQLRDWRQRRQRGGACHLQGVRGAGRGVQRGGRAKVHRQRHPAGALATWLALAVAGVAGTPTALAVY